MLEPVLCMCEHKISEYKILEDKNYLLQALNKSDVSRLKTVT